MAQVTLIEALALPAFRRAAPAVMAGRAGLHRAIRWVHATERADVGRLLRPGDLALTMGTGLPADSDATGLQAFVEELSSVEAVGLVVELGRRWHHDLPAALVDACDANTMPLVALHHESRFAELAQEVGERVVDDQLSELREAHRVHETFTELSFGRAGPVQILEAVQRLAGGPVVIENVQHRPLDYVAGPEDMSGFLDNWMARSRRVGMTGRTDWDENNGWLLARLGSSDQVWGRLVIGMSAAPDQRLIAVAERAAAALAMHHLHDRDRENLMRRTHHEILNGLQNDADDPDVLRRCELAGFPVQRRSYVGLVLRRRVGTHPYPEANELAAAVVRAAHSCRLPALVYEVERDVRVLISVPDSGHAAAATDRLARRVREQHDVVVAAGRGVGNRSAIARTLQEAGQVADAVPPGREATGQDVHRLEDLHLRGLLALFGQDERVQLFVDRELCSLKEHDSSGGTRPDLLSSLRALLHHPTSKTEAAASLHLSRAAFYDRLAKIETILGVDLDDPNVRVSLHVALVADELFGAVLG